MLYMISDDQSLRDLVAESLTRGGVPAIGIAPAALAGGIDTSVGSTVVVDSGLGEAGRQLCRRLRREFPELSIVQLGEGRSVSEIEDAYEAGVDAVIPKRPRLAELISVVNRLARAS